jgi:starch phosphorylase
MRREHRLRRALAALALDLRWAWSHSTDELWEALEPALWQETRNAWLVLQSVSDGELRMLARDRRFLAVFERCRRMQKSALAARPWFEERGAAQALRLVAFFSMEFGLSEALPIYAGGLGVLGGDYLKAASDLGVPVVGVGLLYNQGYFRQVLGDDGWQRELYPPNDPGQLPIVPARDAEGALLRIPIEFPGRTVFARTWLARVARTNLYLLDCNDPANRPADRGITAQLYGGDDEQRLQQEIVLGIGGWRLLTALALRPEICHLNEGHAALAAIERTRTFMAATGLGFADAHRVTRSGTIFTTHTPVEAAFDRFDATLAAKYLAPHVLALGITLDELLALGRPNPSAAGPLNMAYLAVRCSGRINGVSRLHGEVSRALFAPLFPGCPAVDVPVGFVTNGVHTPSWDSAEADAVWTAACGSERWRGALGELAERIEGVPDADLWSMRNANRRRLVEHARERLVARSSEIGAASKRLAEAAQFLDPDVLTLGFARRFTGYKRATLLLHDPDRLVRLLTHPTRPMQLLLAGKAHPHDEQGKEMIRAWLDFADRPEVRRCVLFLGDYDLLLAEQLVQGCDLWINTPRHLMEASGTSGMKVLVNGGLNVSELDGWWAEAYEDGVGWALGEAAAGAPPRSDSDEAEALYALLEDDIAPRFYARDQSGFPSGWIATMRASMARLTARFSMNRMLREYVDCHYLPAASAYRARSEGDGALARNIEREIASLRLHWNEIAFGAVRSEVSDGSVLVRVAMSFGAIDPSLVRVELYADATAGHPRELIAMHPAAADSGTYECSPSPGRPLDDYTARVVPAVPASSPLECDLIRWQR